MTSLKMGKLEKFQKGVDYFVESGKKETVYTVHNKELEKIFVDNFFKEVPKNNNSSTESNYPEKSEKIFCGLREEMPPGKTKGEINNVIYHVKKEEQNYFKKTKILGDDEAPSLPSNPEKVFEKEEKELETIRKENKVQQSLSKKSSKNKDSYVQPLKKVQVQGESVSYFKENEKEIEARQFLRKINENVTLKEEGEELVNEAQQVLDNQQASKEELRKELQKLIDFNKKKDELLKQNSAIAQRVKQVTSQMRQRLQQIQSKKVSTENIQPSKNIERNSDKALWITLGVIGIGAISALVYWILKGKERRNK